MKQICASLSEIEPLRMAKQRREHRYQYDESLEHKSPTEPETSRLAKLQSQATYHKRVTDLFSKISHKKDRQIGHLAFCPKMALYSERPGYLKDWALIEWEPNKFSSAPDNKVFVGINKPGYWCQDDLDNGFLPLHLQDRDLGCGKPIRVAKRGFKAGLKFGEINGIAAVVRRPANFKNHLGWELLIVPSSKERVFSHKGDSGSIIFDRRGAVVGLLTGSTADPPEKWRGIPELKKYPGGTVWPEDAEESPNLATWPDGTDITFATPIQWVLDDIARYTGLEPRLA